jgi:uncharacterized protein
VNWPALAVLGAVIASYAGIYFLSRRRFNFSLLTLSALGVGIVIGLFGRGAAEYIEPIGRIYINLLLASVAPLIIVSIISAITSLGTLEKLRTVGLRSFGWLMLTNVVAVILTLGVALTVGIGSGVNEELGGEELSVLENSVQSFSEVFVNFFPVNVVGDLGSNHIIPIIILATTIAVAYLAVSRKDEKAVRPFRTGIEALRLVIYKAVGYVIKLTPYAVLALTATVVANSVNLTNKFWSLLGLLAVAWVVCFADTYLVNGLFLRIFADVSPVAFFRKIFPAQITAFTTQSSVGTLPVTTSMLTRRVGVHPEVAHFTAPLGTTIGMPGCSGIWPILVAVWGINAYNISYSAQDYLVLALLAAIVSIGVAGVPGTATVAAATVLAAAGLPLEFIAVTLPISMIADMARTATNVTAAATSATIVARQTGLLNDDIFAGRATFDEETGEVIPVPDATPTKAAEVAEPDASVGQNEPNPTDEPALAGANRN